jgi:hypothetical protein
MWQTYLASVAKIRSLSVIFNPISLFDENSTVFKQLKCYLFFDKRTLKFILESRRVIRSASYRKGKLCLMKDTYISAGSSSALQILFLWKIGSRTPKAASGCGNCFVRFAKTPAGPWTSSHCWRRCTCPSPPRTNWTSPSWSHNTVMTPVKF